MYIYYSVMTKIFLVFFSPILVWDELITTWDFALHVPGLKLWNADSLNVGIYTGASTDNVVIYNSNFYHLYSEATQTNV